MYKILPDIVLSFEAGIYKESMSIPGPEISFEKGVPVSITLISTGGTLHDFFVDYNGNGVIDNDEPHK